MLDLEEQFETATRELHDQLDTVSFAPASAVIRRHRRRRYTISAFALVVVAAGVITIGAVATRDSSPSPSNSLEDGLLFPTEMSGGEPTEVIVGPELPDGAAGLVQSPNGALFRISIADGSGELTPDVDRRQINGRTIAVEGADGQLYYSSLDACARIGVLQSEPNATPWNTDALALLAALTIDGRHATVTLPTGWASLGFGNPGSVIQLAYTAKIGDTTHAVVLMQMPDSPIAVLPGVSQGPLTPTTLNGQPAWTVNPLRSTGLVTYLFWEDNGNAVSLYGMDVTVDELKQIATGLQHGKSSEWARYLASATIGAPPGTTAPAGTTAETAAPAGIALAGTPAETTPENGATINSDCGPAQLNIP